MRVVALPLRRAALHPCVPALHPALQARMLGLLDWRVRLDFEAGAWTMPCLCVGALGQAPGLKQCRQGCGKRGCPWAARCLALTHQRVTHHPAAPAEVAPCMHMLFQASLQQAPLPHSPSPVQPPQPPHTAGLEERPVRPCTPECEEAPRRRAAPAPAAVQPAAGLLAEPTPATGPGSAARSAQQGAAAAMHAMCDAIRWQVGGGTGRRRGPRQRGSGAGGPS